MLKKLTPEQQELLLRSAIEEFGEKGLERAAVSTIAKRSGLSVGVIYKYYANKEALFEACLAHSVAMLREVAEKAVAGETSLLSACEKLIRACQSFAREHAAYVRMYHFITTRNDADVARYAQTIEGITAGLYRRLFAKAREEGNVRPDLDPTLFALFFDDLLMMLHFSYGCRYYEERMRIYLGEAEATGADATDVAARTDQDERIVRQLLLFLSGALGIREGANR